MDNIKVLLVEDEAIIAERLYADLTDFGYQVAEPCLKPDQAIEALENELFDLVLLDINLKDAINGIDLGKLINEKYSIPFIFITANTDELTMREAAKVKPSGFLSKPIQLQSLIGTIQIAIYNHQNNKIATAIEANTDYYFVKSGSSFHKIEWSNVLYIESDNKYAMVYEQNTKAPYALRITLENLAQQLAPFKFVRIHKSCLVNLAQVKTINSSDLVVGDKQLAIGEAYRKNLMQQIKTMQ
jgi:two-component system, LytTR family, response regulator LytT